MPERIHGSNKLERAMTPLWVISLFVSLSEVVTGIAVTQASGGIQIALTSFVIAFPVMVGFAFFFILWSRPEVLYSPGEYGADTDVTEYVEAMRRRTETDAKALSLIRGAVNDALTTPEVISRMERMLKAGGAISEEKLAGVLRDASEAAWSSIEKKFVTIDPTSIMGSDGQIRQLPYDPDEPIGRFLDDVWLSVFEKIPAYHYGDFWFVRDTHSGFELREAGREWAKKHGTIEDTRSVEEVGIRPGMYLETVLTKSTRHSSSGGSKHVAVVVPRSTPGKLS